MELWSGLNLCSLLQTLIDLNNPKYQQQETNKFIHGVELKIPYLMFSHIHKILLNDPVRSSGCEVILSCCINIIIYYGRELPLNQPCVQTSMQEEKKKKI